MVLPDAVRPTVSIKFIHTSLGMSRETTRRKVALFLEDREHLEGVFHVLLHAVIGKEIGAKAQVFLDRQAGGGHVGGDQQIGALISTGEVDMLVFFVDPLTPMPHDVDVKALMRLATVYDIPMALNLATADILMQTLTA